MATNTLFTAHLHWGKWIKAIWNSVLLYTIVLALLLARQDSAVILRIVLPFVLPSIILLITYVRYVNNHYEITASGLVLHTGVLRHTSYEIDHGNIIALSYHQDRLGQILGYGTLIVVVDGKKSRLIPYITNAKAFSEKFKALRATGSIR